MTPSQCHFLKTRHIPTSDIEKSSASTSCPAIPVEKSPLGQIADSWLSGMIHTCQYHGWISTRVLPKWIINHHRIIHEFHWSTLHVQKDPPYKTQLVSGSLTYLILYRYFNFLGDCKGLQTYVGRFLQSNLGDVPLMHLWYRPPNTHASRIKI